MAGFVECKCLHWWMWGLVQDVHRLVQCCEAADGLCFCSLAIAHGGRYCIFLGRRLRVCRGWCCVEKNRGKLLVVNVMVVAESTWQETLQNFTKSRLLMLLWAISTCAPQPTCISITSSSPVNNKFPVQLKDAQTLTLLLAPSLSISIKETITLALPKDMNMNTFTLTHLLHPILKQISESWAAPVHLDASLYNAPEEVVNPDVTFQQYLLSALSSDSSPHQPSRSPSAPLHPSPDADISQGSPMNIDGDLPSALKVHPLSLHLLVEATPMTLTSRYHHYWAAYLQSVLLFMITAPVTLPLMITLLLSSKSEW